MTLIPGIKQISQVGNDMYIQGAFPVGVTTTDVDYLADPADTRLLAGRDPVIEEVSVGMTGSETGIETASGAAPLQITDAMRGMLRFLETNIKPVQDLHGYDSPWPAGGGKNLLNPSFIQGSAIDLTKTDRIVSQYYIQVKSGETYTFSSDNYTNYEYVLNSANVGTLPITGTYTYCGTNTTWVVHEITFTATNDGYVFVVVRKVGGANIAPSDVANVKMQFEKSATPTSFAPYSNICPISGWTGAEVYIEPTYDPTATPKASVTFGKTVYGGTADAVQGSGSETVGEVDLGSLTWNGTSQNRFYATIDDALNSNENRTDILCEAYKPEAVVAQNNCWLYQQKIYIVDANYSTSDAFATAVNGIKLTYPLATPTDYTFPGNQIQTQEGTNYIWTDCGDQITAAYVAVK